MTRRRVGPGRPGSRLLGWLARLVPADRRRDWLAEWTAERAHHGSGGAGRQRLAGARVLLAAAEDAVRLRARRVAPGDLLRDARFGLRLLRRNPTFTVAAIVTTALGVGANAAVFTVVNAVLLRPLEYPEADRIVQLVGFWRGRETGALSHPNVLDIEERVASLEALASWMPWAPVLRVDEPQRLHGLAVSHAYFELYARRPALGRYLLPGEDALDAEPVVVLGHEMWRSRFAADPGVVGRSIELDGVAHRIVGVAEPGLREPSGLLVEAFRNPPPYLRQDERRMPWLSTFARLREGVGMETAQSELTAIAGALVAEHPVDNADWEVRLSPLRERVAGRLRPVVLVLLGAVVLVLLVACANVANLMLARGAARRRELAIRRSLGAATGRLVRQLMVESLVVALLGGALGVALAWLALQPARAGRLPGIPAWVELVPDATVLAFTLAATALTGCLFALAPLWQMTATAPVAVLREAGQGASAGGRRVRGLLAVAELGLATLLLAGAGLMVRSFANLVAVDSGIEPRGVLAFSVSRMDTIAEPAPMHNEFSARLRERLAAIPGVMSVGHASSLPLTEAVTFYDFTVDGAPPPEPGQTTLAAAFVVSPGYFRALGYRLLAGRYPAATDDLGGPPICLVNEAFVREHLGGEEPLGRGITVYGASHPIVGVVGDVHQLGPAVPPRPAIYTVHAQAPTPGYLRPNASVVIKVDGDPLRIAGAVRVAVREIDRTVAVEDLGPMAQNLERYRAEPRFYTLLIGAFALLATTLAAVGVAGVVSCNVAARVREIGIRRALGAGRHQVVRLVLAEVGRLAAGGLIAGIAAALAVTRLMERLLFGVEPNDAATLLAVTAGLAAVSLLAGYLPARRASRVDPTVALRGE